MSIAAFAALIIGGYGLAVAGPLGALTGAVVAITIGSGLAIFRGEAGTGVNPILTAMGVAQRVGGVVAALGALSGALIAGWSWGWLGAILGYGVGMLIAGVLTLSLGRGNRLAPRPHVASTESSRSPLRDVLGASDFDLDNRQHVVIVDEIREKYGEALARKCEDPSLCMFRSEADLPYEKGDIRKALEALLAFSEERASSDYVDVSLRSPEFADTLRSCLLHLENDFLPVPAEEVPTERHANGAFGFKYHETGSLEEAREVAKAFEGTRARYTGGGVL